jgi:hypothetical protein
LFIGVIPTGNAAETVATGLPIGQQFSSGYEVRGGAIISMQWPK